jgi:hypothetical protein
MSQAVVVKQGEWVTEGYFAQPVFGLFKELPELLTHLFKRLQGYGFTLNGTRFQNADSHLGEAHLRCTLFGSVLRIFLDRLDISSNLEQGAAGHDRRWLDAVESLQAYLPDLVFNSYTAWLKLHGVLPGVRPEQVLPKLVSAAPASPGPLLLAGAVFHYGAGAGRLSSSLNIEPSAVIEEGLYVQTRVIYNADRIQLDGLSEASRHYLGQALAELEIVLEGLT